MFFKSLLLAVVSAVVLVGTVKAANYTGIANLGFFDTTNCGCPPWNGPYAIAIPSNLVGDAVCCDATVTLSYSGETVDAVFSGTYSGGAGPEDIALSPLAFGAIAGWPEETALFPVVWYFD
ncbi:hypothetical protein DFH07DRAFT_798873 [Mycena maculata]|uniref:Uncharacterized protein n=1 Tax=Mycena maculata TaxID=230809 RepID=A0AAD7NUR0_9AGAR|nr:hypothetical protein DFH07DRAFT_798873 [Mycena maculata]